MQTLNKNLLAAVDIGSTKIVCFIANITSEGKINVIGIGHHLARGIKSGNIVDIEQAEKSIRSAVGSAEQMAGVNIDRIVASISGKYNHSDINKIFFCFRVSRCEREVLVGG